MRRIVFLYGVACYALFFAIFLYVPGFLANRWVRQPSALTQEVIVATLNKTHNNRSQAALRP